MGVNREVVSQWFDAYTSLLAELQIIDTPSHIWNTDESALQTHLRRACFGTKRSTKLSSHPGE